MFICLFFICGFSSHSGIFHLYWDVTITGEGLQILTNARHSWPLSSEGSLTCHSYCDTGLPCIMVISEDPWHSPLLPSVWQWSCHYLFLRLRSFATGDRTPISRMRGERSTSTPPRWSRMIEYSQIYTISQSKSISETLRLVIVTLLYVSILEKYV